MSKKLYLSIGLIIFSVFILLCDISLSYKCAEDYGFRIKGKLVGWGIPKQKVMELLGYPHTVKENDEIYYGYDIKMYYENNGEEDLVFIITAFGKSKVPTERGIRIGDSYSKVRKFYGKSTKITKGKDGNIFVWYGVARPEFGINKHKKVTTIEYMGCAL